MDFKQTLKLRQSVRLFKEDQISDEQLNAVLDAAYLAPVAMGNYEDVKLVVIQNADVLTKLNESFAAKIGNPDMKPTYGAPTVIYVCEKEDMEDILSGANAGAVVESMLLAAVNEGLASCYLFGVSQVLHKDQEIKDLLQIPEGYRSVSAIALGLPQEVQSERAAADIDTIYVK